MEYLVFFGISAIIFMLGVIYGRSYNATENIVDSEWDLKLNSLLDNGITSLSGSYIVKFGNLEVWRTGDSLGHIYISAQGVLSLSPKRATKKRLLSSIHAYEVEAIQNAKP